MTKLEENKHEKIQFRIF